MHCTTLISMIIDIFMFAAMYSNLWSKISIFHALRINFSNFRECKILEIFSSFARRAHSLAANMKFSHLNLLSGNDFKRELFQLPTYCCSKKSDHFTSSLQMLTKKHYGYVMSMSISILFLPYQKFLSVYLFMVFLFFDAF